MTFPHIIALVFWIALGATSAFSQPLTQPQVTIVISGREYSKFDGDCDSTSAFFASYPPSDARRLLIESKSSCLPSGLVEFIRKTSLYAIELIGLDEDVVLDVLSNVSPERITSVTLGSTSLSAVPEQLRHFTSLRDLTLDTLRSVVPCWVSRELVMLEDLNLGRQVIRLAPCSHDDINTGLFIHSFTEQRDSSLNLDSIFHADGVYVQTVDHYTFDLAPKPFTRFKEIDVWASNGVNLGRMDYDHCIEIGSVLWDQIVHCLNDRVPFTDKDPARCAEYLDLVRTKRVLRVDLIPEGVLIERSFLVTGNQAKRLRRFIDCSSK